MHNNLILSIKYSTLSNGLVVLLALAYGAPAGAPGNAAPQAATDPRTITPLESSYRPA